MIDVYQSSKPTFTTEEPQPAFPEGFVRVARVNTESAEIAFERTNHIDIPWWENEGVETFIKGRSTSVGDVMLHVENGTREQVASMGFQPFTH